VTGGAPAPVRRVVSLVPSVTETLVAWGVPPVACTRFCEQPDLAHVGGTKDPDVGAIVDLAPDLVVMCVEENRREDADALAEAGVTTAALAVDGLADVAPALRMLAGLVGVDPAVVEDVGAAAAPPRLRAFVPIWRRPWMSLADGTYGSSLLAALGVANVFADAADRYPTVTLDEARARRPDVVLAPSEPYPFRERHVPELAEVAPVVLVDGQDLFWWGARTPDALARLGTRLADALG
jgi:ABC-type Fe3+-hydroxamate transport system substrate-binding protein